MALLTDGLIGYFMCDEITGSHIDVVGDVSLGVSGLTRDVNGILRTTSQGDGVNDRARDTTAPSLAVTGELTISAWVYPTATPGGAQGVFARRSGDGDISYVMRRVGSQMRFEFSPDGTQASAIKLNNTTLGVGTNAWRHVVFIKNDTDNKIYYYRDGVLDSADTDTAGAAIFGGTGTVCAWATPTAANSFSEYFPGRIDEIGIWNRALVAREVDLVYRNGNALPYPLGFGYEPIRKRRREG